MSERPVAPTNCFFQGCYNPAYEAEIRRAKDACHRFNQLSPTTGRPIWPSSGSSWGKWAGKR